ncbi:hypothetical protein HYQ46_000151 [Verticillium longisporum]|nr:hypothetical protein HYQ46_000151 [Verticillium longisporum]
MLGSFQTASDIRHWQEVAGAGGLCESLVRQVFGNLLFEITLLCSWGCCRRGEVKAPSTVVVKEGKLIKCGKARRKLIASPGAIVRFGVESSEWIAAGDTTRRRTWSLRLRG